MAILGKRSPETCDCFGIFLVFFYGWQPLGKGILKVEIALELFLFLFLGGNSGKKRVLEIWDCFGIIFLYFFWVATLGKGSLEI